MGREKDGKRTRERLADALLDLMADRGLGQVRVQEVAERAGVNRQTFYYHFSDIYALSEYAYDREITRLFGLEDIEATFDKVSPYEHSTRILQALRDSPQGLRKLLLFFNGRDPRGHFHSLLRHDAEVSLTPRLREAGVSEQDISVCEDMCATAVEAILLDWLRSGTPVSAEQVVLRIKAFTTDVADGVARRGSLV